jgi:hypothetical protein
MYKILRNTHLLLGLFLCCFVVMFGLSSLQIAHSWMNNRSTDTESTFRVEPSHAATPRALAQYLMDEHGMRGGLDEVKETADEVSFVIGRMGTVHEVHYARAGSEVHVKKSVRAFIGILLAMHRGGFGLDKPYGLHVFWGLLMFLTSAGLLILGATGIYMWFHIYKERLVGSILLLAGLAYGLGLVVMVWVG